MVKTRLLDAGRRVYGGSPPRFLRLTEAGARAFRRLLLTDDRSAAPELVERLVDAGILPPERPAFDVALPDYAVVVPHYNNPDAALRTLTALRKELADVGGPTVIVVDDGSEPRLRAQLEIQIDQLRSDRFDVKMVACESNGGPAAARNTGFAHSTGEVTVFIDSGVTTDLRSVESLVRWTTVADAAGPRVTSPNRQGPVGRFESKNSALDMNAASQLAEASQPQLVGPQRVVRYLPTAALAVLNDAIREVNGFDEAMRTGEDVDFVWRLVEAGRRIVFDPMIVADHEPRGSVRAFAAQRFGYGRSGGPLGQRHGSTVAPAVARPPLLVAIAGSLIAPLPIGLGLGVAAAAVDAVETGRRFSSATSGYPTAGALGATESVRFNGLILRGWIKAAIRAWWPLTALAIAQPFSKRLRKRVVAVIALRLTDLVATVGIAQTPMAIIDEVAYGAGLWTATKDTRSLRPLLPRIL